MKNLSGAIRRNIKNNPVLFAAALLAVFSMCFIRPDEAYLTYIDFKVILLLFCLMLVVAGWQKEGLFEYAGRLLCARTKTYKSLCAVLCALCFFSSMFITNDVALITSVPFTIAVFHKQDSKSLIRLIVFETIAANTGSMLTPVGNPQNLYLYTLSGMSVAEFIITMLPISLLSFVLIFIAVYAQKYRPPTCMTPLKDGAHVLPGKRIWIYSCLFALSMLCVFRVMSYYILTPVVLLCIIITDRSLFKKVDYALLATFICLFVFIGNVGRIQTVRDTLSGLIDNREILIGALLSQFISNVPAAMLLSGFTQRYADLLQGIDIGGLGTLIASMASLISYRFYAAQKAADKKAYIRIFSIYNFAMLFILIAFAYGIKLLFA